MAQHMMPSDIYNTFHNVVNMARIVIGWSSISLEVFVRRDFGERYFGIGRFAASWIIIQFFYLLISLPAVFTPGYVIPMPSIRIYLICFFVASAAHLLRIWQRNSQDTLWHADSIGVSWFSPLLNLPPLKIGFVTLRITDYLLYRFIEPVLCLIVIQLLLPEGVTQTWLTWAAIAMLIHNNMVYNQRRSRVLDLINAQIEAEVYNQLRESSSGIPKTAYETAGYQVMPLPKALLTSQSNETRQNGTMFTAPAQSALINGSTEVTPLPVDTGIDTAQQ